MQSVLTTRTEGGGGDAYSRAKFVELLGRFGDRRDVPLLIGIVRSELPEVRPSDRATLRGAALRGLASLGGEDAANVLLDQLSIARSNRSSPSDSVMIAGRLPLPAATALLVDLLDAPDMPTVLAAVRALQQRGDRAAIPALEARLTNGSNRAVRQSVANALRTAGDGVSLPLMRALVSDADLDVRATALSHVARRGDASDLPAFVEHLPSPRTHESALEGIDRLGRAEDFLLLRSQLETVPRESRTFVTMALYRLTFAPIWWDPSEWDAWWVNHSRSTRAEWAREALADGGNLAPLALEYLARSGNAPIEMLEEALVSRNVGVRLAAAGIVGESDWRRAVLLIARELSNRSVTACGQAVVAFNSLTARNERVDCTNFSDRAAMQARWQTLGSARQ